jgi:predicted HD superfamily hydrolase involved in NAD metabolism
MDYIGEIMKEYEDIKSEIKLMLNSKRFQHSINVEKAAVMLGKIYGVEEYKCKIAGIAHDCAKYFNDKALITHANEYGIIIDNIQNKIPSLLHGPVAAMYSKETFNIYDQDILNAIWYHTTGRADMSNLEKIIYLADLIEESRDFKEVNSIRKKAVNNLDEALLLACNCTLNYIMRSNTLIHPLTIEFRNSLLMKGRINNG